MGRARRLTDLLPSEGLVTRAATRSTWQHSEMVKVHPYMLCSGILMACNRRRQREASMPSQPQWSTKRSIILSPMVPCPSASFTMHSSSRVETTEGKTTVSDYINCGNRTTVAYRRKSTSVATVPARSLECNETERRGPRELTKLNQASQRLTHMPEKQMQPDCSTKILFR